MERLSRSLFDACVDLNPHQIEAALFAFRDNYVNDGGNLDALKSRLQAFCRRTLRRQVLEYIKFTERRAITRPFNPTDEEQALYEALSNFLQRAETYSSPKKQQQLVTLVTRDQEYDLIYVNGDNNLENLGRGDQTWKVRLIGEDFHRLMWKCQDI